MAVMNAVSARLAGVLAAVGPPVAVAGVWRDVVMNHPVLALVLLVGYEILVAVLLFAGKIAAQLRERWQERIVNRLDRALGQRISRFGKRYREFVLASLRFIDLKGLATVGFYTPELDDVFVDVSLAFREPNQASAGLLAALPAEVTDRHSIQDFLDRSRPIVLAVIGAPGSGKTTLLRHTARQLCRVHRDRRRTVPILLYLRDHVTTIASTPDVALPELVRGTLGRYRADEPDGWFEQRLNDGDCLVLLDGLDEVARPEDRRGTAGWIERQIRQYPKNDFVITSRPQGYLAARIDGAAVLQVRSFTDEQVTRFVQRWYLAVERRSTGAMGEDIRLRAESAADDLLRRLNDAPGLYDLTVNPLLLTMIANVHRYRGALPGSRVDLYGEICQVMLWRRQEAKNLPITPNVDKKEALLRGLAFAMMKRQVRDLSRGDVLAEINPALRRIPRMLTAEEFLTDTGSNGLLIERESGLYSFAHQTFQEYLAATHIRDKGLSKVLVDAVDDSWWRETTLLYTSRSDADPIVQACLASASVTALSLACDCAEQGSELAPELRDRLDDLLASAFASDTVPERRRLVAGVLLTRHLRHVARTGDGGNVCVRPITTGLYRLYQQDTRCPAPEHPTDVESGGEEPITGVRGSDAVAFVHWVNGINGGATVYRLPNFAEISDPALTTPAPRISSRSVWLESDNEHDQPELWISAGTDHPHRIDAATLVSHVKDDIERATPTLTRLVLLRSIIIFRIFILDFARSRSFGSDPARLLALEHALHLDRDLAHVLARIPVVAGDLDRARDHVLDRARELHRVLRFELPQALDLNAVGAYDPDPDIYVDRERRRRHGPALDRANERARQLPADLYQRLSGACALARTLAREVEVDFEIDLTVELDSLSYRLTRVLHRYESTDTLPTNFAQVFLDEAGIINDYYIVSPDSLVDKVRSGQQGLMDLIGPPDEADFLPWVYRVEIILRETALPVLTRQQPLTTDTATAIRLAALRLAAEADTRQAKQLGNTFREIAVGVTLLERRATGQAVPTETIMLAVT